MYQPSPFNFVGLYEKALPDSMSWQEKFQAAKDLAFDFIEISIDESDERRARLDWSDDEIYQFKRLSEQYQMPVHSMCLSAHRKFPFGSQDEHTRQKALEYMQKAIVFAYKLGIRIIQLAGYDVYYEPANEQTHQRFIAGMKLSARLAEQFGVMLAVEIMDTEYLNSISKFEILKREIPSPYFMVYPDVGNINGWNYDTCSELKLGRDHIVQIHLKDTLKVRDDYKGQFRDLVLGEGQVDFTAIFSALAKIDYAGPFVIEMWAKDNNWKQNLVQAKRVLHQAALVAGFPAKFD